MLTVASAIKNEILYGDVFFDPQHADALEMYYWADDLLDAEFGWDDPTDWPTVAVKSVHNWNL